MAQEFFNHKVPPERWEKLKKEAEEYDKKELEHAHALDQPLTGELLLAIVDAEQKAKISEMFESIKKMVSELGQEIKTSASPRANQKIIELQLALSTIEGAIVEKKPLPAPNTIRI